MISRQAWGADNVKMDPISFPVATVFLHHTATSATSDGAKDMRNIESGEQANGYLTIAYTAVGHPNGNVYAGRIVNNKPMLGAATKDWNSKSLAYCLIGNYMTDRPTPAALETCAQTIASWVKSGYVTKDFRLRPHKDVFATACPGTNLDAQLATIKTRIDQILKGDTMSTDKLTRAEITTIRRLAIGSNPSDYVLDKYEGKPLTDYLDAVKVTDDTFINRVREGSLIEPKDCPTAEPSVPPADNCNCDVDSIVDAVTKAIKEQWTK